MGWKQCLPQSVAFPRCKVLESRPRTQLDVVATKATKEKGVDGSPRLQFVDVDVQRLQGSLAVFRGRPHQHLVERWAQVPGAKTALKDLKRSRSTSTTTYIYILYIIIYIYILLFIYIICYMLYVIYYILYIIYYIFYILYFIFYIYTWNIWEKTPRLLIRSFLGLTSLNFVSFVSKDLVDPINLQPQGRSLRWRARHQAAIPTASRCQFIDVLHTDRAFIDWGHPIFTEGRHQPFGIPAKAQARTSCVGSSIPFLSTRKNWKKREKLPSQHQIEGQLQ